MRALILQSHSSHDRITQFAMFWRDTSAPRHLSSCSMRYSGSALEYLPFTMYAISDGVANDPLIGGLGIGARTMFAGISSPAALAPQHSGHL